MQNLLLLHLESLSRQPLGAFGHLLPHTRAAMARGVSFERYFSPATSTLMAVTALCHGNGAELDGNGRFGGVKAAGHSPHLFRWLAGKGRRAELLVHSPRHEREGTELSTWPSELPLWGSGDAGAVASRFRSIVRSGPFAVYGWTLGSHVQHAFIGFSGQSRSVEDQLAQAFAEEDRLVGALMAVLEKEGRLGDTVVVLVGDHGDDWWTHGFKSGLAHAVEPYAALTWCPMAIVAPGLAPGATTRLASGVDLMPTILRLLGEVLDHRPPFYGIDLFGSAQDVVFAQNVFANQPDVLLPGALKGYAAMDEACLVLATPEGHRLYHYLMDPGNHRDLSGMFEGERLRRPADPHNHFKASWGHEPYVRELQRRYVRLKDALRGWIVAKEALVGPGLEHPFDLSAFDRPGQAFFAEGPR